MTHMRLIWLAIFSTSLMACGGKSPPTTNPAPAAQDAEAPAAGPAAPAPTREVHVAEVPTAVSAALTRARPQFKVSRVVERAEGGGLLVYEFSGTTDGQDATVEVKYDGRMAEVLTARNTG